MEKCTICYASSRPKLLLDKCLLLFEFIENAFADIEIEFGKNLKFYTSIKKRVSSSLSGWIQANLLVSTLRVSRQMSSYPQSTLRVRETLRTDCSWTATALARNYNKTRNGAAGRSRITAECVSPQGSRSRACAGRPETIPTAAAAGDDTAAPPLPPPPVAKPRVLYSVCACTMLGRRWRNRLGPSRDLDPVRWTHTHAQSGPTPHPRP